jgi:hypothetical protein
LASPNRRHLALGGLVNAIPLAGPCWASGYALEVARRAASGDDSLPEWKGWRRFFIDGIAYYLIPTIYLLPALILYAIVASMFAVWLAAQVPALGFVAPSGPLLIALAFAATLLALLGAYPVPAALNTYAQTRRYRPAFRLRTLLRAIRAHAPAYRRAFAWSVISALAALAWQATLIAHLVGLLAIPFLGFYLQLAWAHLFAQVLPAEVPSPRRRGNPR